MKKEEVSKVMKHLSKKGKKTRFGRLTRKEKKEEMRKMSRKMWDNPEFRTRWYKARWGKKK